MLGRPGTPGDSPQQLPLVLALPGRHLLKDAPHAALVSPPGVQRPVQQGVLVVQVCSHQLLPLSAPQGQALPPPVPGPAQEPR